MKIIAVALFLLTLLISCSTRTINQKLEKDVFYRRDMIVKVNGKSFEGMGVVDSAKKYSFHIEARGELDLFIFSSCNRDWTKERAWNIKTKVKSGLFGWGRKLVDKKREIQFPYTPIREVEANYCPVWLSGAEIKRERHSWGFVDFRPAWMVLPARLECNGEVLNPRGVAVCQSREGLTQILKFKDEMLVEGDKEKCQMPSDRGSKFEFQIPYGDCVFRFLRVKKPHHEFRLTTYGYRKILIRQIGD